MKTMQIKDKIAKTISTIQTQVNLPVFLVSLIYSESSSKSGTDGGTGEKPVGLVYVGCQVNGKIRTEEFRFTGNRAKNREYAVVRALTVLWEQLMEA